MTSRIWSELLSSYVGEVQENGRVWSERHSAYVGEVQSTGRVWSDRSNSYVGEVQDSGRVWSEDDGAYIGEVQDSGKIWSDVSGRYVGEVKPSNRRHGGAALLLLLPVEELPPPRPRPRPRDDEETNWIAVLFAIGIAFWVAIIFAVWRYRYVRALFFLGVAVAAQFAVFITVQQSFNLHFGIAALAGAAASAPLYRFCVSALRWRAKEGARINAWAATGVLAVLTLGVNLYVGMYGPDLALRQIAAVEPTRPSVPATAPTDPAAVAPDSLSYVVEPYSASLTAQVGGALYRAGPSDADGVEVFGYTTAGETLDVIGRVSDGDSVWYQVQLRSGQVAYVESAAVSPQTDVMDPTPSLAALVGDWERAGQYCGRYLRVTESAGSLALQTSQDGQIWRVLRTLSSAVTSRDPLTVTFQHPDGIAFSMTAEGSRLRMEALNEPDCQFVRRQPTDGAAFSLAPAGSWRGRMNESGTRYDLIVDFYTAPDRRLAARITYVELECSGTWEGDPGSADAPGPWRLRESITVGRLNCVNYGIVDLSSAADGALLMEYRRQGATSVSVSGILRSQ